MAKDKLNKDAIFTLTIPTFYDTYTRNVRIPYRFYFVDN